MSATYSQCGPQPPFESVDVIRHDLNPITEATMDCISTYYDLEEALEEAAAKLAKVTGTPGGDTDAATEEGVALTVRTQVLAAQLETQRLAVIDALKADRLRHLGMVEVQRRHHHELRARAREESKAMLDQVFGKRESKLVRMQHGKSTTTEVGSRIILDTLYDQRREIDAKLREFQTDVERGREAVGA